MNERENINMFVTDCIDLYLHGTKPRHGELFRFRSWAAVTNHYHENYDFQRINRMLQQGYSHNDWKNTLAKLVERGRFTHSLGMIGDVRNYEFDTVMLGPKITTQVWNTEPTQLAAVSSSVYVSITRARRRLIMPEGLRNWVEEIFANRIPQPATLQR